MASISARGKIDIEVDDNGVKAHGPVIVGGQKASISWARSFNSTDKRDEVMLDATLDDMARRKLGFDVSGFVQGPIKARVSGLIEGRKLVKADIDADLSRAYAFLDVIGWSRPPTAKTLASLSIDLTSPKAIVIKDLKISGKDLKIQGNIGSLPTAGLSRARCRWSISTTRLRLGSGSRRSRECSTCRSPARPSMRDG